MIEVFRGFWINPEALVKAQFAADGTRCNLSFLNNQQHVVTGRVRVDAVRQVLQVIEWGTLCKDPHLEQEVIDDLVPARAA